MAVIKGGAKLEAYLADLAKKVTSAKMLRVGFLEGATYPNGTSVPMIAAIQEFGAPSRGIPPRPFFSNMVQSHQGEWGPQIGDILATNGGDAQNALSLMGEVIKGELQQSIVDTNSPPNSPVTNLLKQRFPQGGQTFQDVLDARRDAANGETAPAGKPLVQSGVMLNAVGSEVS